MSDRQERFKLHKHVDAGEDELGEYKIIPLSMVYGGKLTPTKVYTRPVKHVVGKSAPSPRGWYKDKHEPASKRPRPCYTEATLTTPYGGYCPVGCRFCLGGNALVDTPNGRTMISDLRPGDVVYGRTWFGIEEIKILATHTHQVSGYYKVTLEDGQQFDITGEHPVFVLGRGWTPIQEVDIEKERLESLRSLQSDIQLLNAAQASLRCLQVGEKAGDSCQVECHSEAQAGCKVISDLQVLWWLNWISQAEGSLPRERVRECSKEICCKHGLREKQGEGISKRLEVVGGDKTETKQGHDTKNGGGGEPSSGQTQDFGVATQDGGTYADLREYGMQGSQIGELGWSKISLDLGVRNCQVFKSHRLGLGIRRIHLYDRWSCTHTGFPSVCRFCTDGRTGSKGLLFGRGERCSGCHTGRSCRGWHSVSGVGRERIGVSGSVKISSIDYVDDTLDVWDIETNTHNFYAHGVLVHNCYVTHGTRGYRATGIATSNPDYPDLMAKCIQKMNVSGAFYISSFTEPFQHLEDTYHITQRLTEVIVGEELPLFYLTRLLPPDWAVDALLANPYSYMQWSINTSNDHHRRLMSPGIASYDAVFAKMHELSSRGIYISVQCNPILAGITTLDELVDLVRLVADAGGHHIIFKFAEQVYSNRKLLLERLSKSRLPNVDKFDKLLSQTIGGVYTIDQGVRLEWLRVLLEETRDYDITMSTCYEYYDNKTQGGANLAPWFTTSDQCHGRGVPIYYRPELGAQFKPLPGCYRKGCLWCKEYGTRACGNEELLQAKALQYKDLRSITVDAAGSWAQPDSCFRPEAVELVCGNYDLDTDAELWGWPTIDEHLESLENG